MEQSGDNRGTQKITIGVQRGNAASVMETIPSTASSQDWAEFAFLPTVLSLIILIFFVVLYVI